MEHTQSTLPFLPADIIGFVSFYLEEADLTNLVKTCDRNLHRKLSQPGAVTELKLKTRRKLNFFLHFLPGLSGLRSLVFPASSVDINEPPTPLVVSFPPSLTSLEVPCPAYLVTYTRHVPGGVESYYRQMLEYATTNLPLLRRLVLPLYYGQSETTPALEYLECACISASTVLPSSLTHLTLYSQSRWPIVPPNLISLQKLEVTTTSIQTSGSVDLAAFVAFLPPSLTWLSLAGVPHREWDGSLVPRFPKGIKHWTIKFEEPSAFTTVVWKNAQEQQGSSDPSQIPCLQTLELLRVGSASTVQLPSSLTRLTIGLSGAVDPPFFASLPRTLLHLTISPSSNHAHMTLIAEPLDIPPSLVSLHLETVKLDHCALASVPPAVTSLQLEEIIFRRREDRAASWQFPKALTKLNCQTVPLVPAFFHALVFDCTDLEHVRFRMVTLDTLMNRDDQLRDGRRAIAANERNVKAFEKISSNVPPFQFGLNLRSYHVNQGLLGNEFVSILSPSLTSLSLPQSDFITDVSVHLHVSKMIALKSLILRSRVITSKSFASLPSSLTSLELTNLSYVDDADVASLPRSLLSLRLPAAKNISPACGPFLPPKIRDFYSHGESYARSRYLAQNLAQYFPQKGKVTIASRSLTLVLYDGLFI
jgi:hypothetical protein